MTYYKAERSTFIKNKYFVWIIICEYSFGDILQRFIKRMFSWLTVAGIIGIIFHSLFICYCQAEGCCIPEFRHEYFAFITIHWMKPNSSVIQLSRQWTINWKDLRYESNSCTFILNSIMPSWAPVKIWRNSAPGLQHLSLLQMHINIWLY